MSQLLRLHFYLLVATLALVDARILVSTMDELNLEFSLVSRRSDGHGADRGHVALITTAVLTGIAGFVVVLRFVTRSLLVKYIGREDWIIIAALVSTCGSDLSYAESQVDL